MLTNKFDVKIELITELLGTVPKNKEIYKEIIETEKPVEILEDESETVEEVEEKGWTGFHSDEKGLFVYDYFLKGFIKNAGNILKDELKIKNLRAKVSNFVFVEPRRIYLGKTEPSGILDRPIRMITRKGERTALIRSDFIGPGTQISFQILLLSHSEITVKVLENLFQYGRLMGLGQWRNGGYGRFKVVEFLLCL